MVRAAAGRATHPYKSLQHGLAAAEYEGLAERAQRLMVEHRLDGIGVAPQA